MTEDWFEKNKEYYNFLVNNLVYCENTHSVAHRFYDKLLESFVKKINDKYIFLEISKEKLESIINYKDAQFLMQKVLEEMNDDYEEHNNDKVFRDSPSSTESKE